MTPSTIDHHKMAIVSLSHTFLAGYLTSQHLRVDRLLDSTHMTLLAGEPVMYKMHRRIHKNTALLGANLLRAASLSPSQLPWLLPAFKNDSAHGPIPRSL